MLNKYILWLVPYEIESNLAEECTIKGIIVVKQVKASFMSLCPSTSISHLTSTYNERISNEWNKLNIESDSKINKIAGIKTDWRDLLKTASKEIKRASYQLSTLVTDGEQHVQLFNGSLQDLELLDSFPKYCKIFWK